MNNLQEEKIKKIQEELSKKQNIEQKSKRNLKVEEIDEDNIPINNSNDILAAEYVAQSKQLQNATNDPIIDKELAMGYLYVNNNHLNEAVEYFTTFLKKYPKVVGGYLGRGTAYAMLGKLIEALSDFSMAIEIDPNCGDAYKRRGQTLVACNKLKEGLNDLNIAVSKCNPKDGDCYSQRGSVYQMLKNYEFARNDFIEATKRNSMDHVAWNHLGLNNNALGLVAEAADAYARSLQIKDDYIDCYVNLGQLQKDAGQFQRSKDIFSKLFRLCPQHSYGHYLCGVLYQQVGYHLQATKEFTLSINNMNDPIYGLDKDNDRKTDCYRYRGVTRSASGLFRLAVQDFEKAIELKSDDSSWYMKEIALYTHHLLNKPFNEWNLEGFYPFFKEGFCKHLIPAALHRYVEQPSFDSSIVDVDENKIPPKNVIDKLLIPAMNIGKYIQYNSQGFVKNKSQYFMAGMASIQIAKLIRDRLPEWVFGGLTEAQAKNYIHKIKWREVMEIAVKWRQLSEPNDSVFWIDGLTHEQFEEGFGSHTPMFIGQTRVVRYYCQYERAFKIVKELLPQQITLKKEWNDKIYNAKNIQDILDVLKSDFHVTTPCRSDNFDDPDKPGHRIVYEGTRLIVEQKQPHGYEFAIKTPCTMARWVKYDKELTACWEKIVLLALTRKHANNDPKENEALLRAALSFSFFWYNFMPLSRGTAACGLVILMSLLASVGLKINKNIPSGMQTDWEAILCEYPKQFADVMLSWLKDSIGKLDIESILDINKGLPTLRNVIELLNYCPNIEC